MAQAIGTLRRKANLDKTLAEERRQAEYRQSWPKAMHDDYFLG